MILNIVLIVVGFVCLIKGADWLVLGAAGLAKKYQVSDLVIGLTIVAFGTSMPELVVNGFSSFQGHSGLIYGNIIGSNIFNLFLILGLTAVIYPITVNSRMVRKEIPVSLVAVFLTLFFSNAILWQTESVLTRWEALLFLLLFVLFMYYTFKQSPDEIEIDDDLSVNNMSGLKIWGLIIIGLTLLIVGGRLVVDNAVLVAEILGLSENVIGLTVVAVGTSLPELVTSVIAASKKKSDIAIGNVVGSNIMNIFLILGISGLIKPVTYDAELNLELIMLSLGTILLVLYTFVGKRNRIDRWQGAVLFIAFVVYMSYKVSLEM